MKANIWITSAIQKTLIKLLLKAAHFNVATFSYFKKKIQVADHFFKSKTLDFDEPNLGVSIAIRKKICN